VSFIIDTLYGKLGLTTDQQAVVNAALPSIKDALDVVDAHLDDINTIEQLLVVNQVPIKQLLADWAVVGPNISSSIVDGPVDLFGILGAYNDAKSTIAANPKNVQAITALFSKLMPVCYQLMADWPKIKPAVQVIVNASQQGGVTVGNVMDHFKNVDLGDGG
jgi:hypothetical protein